jgi:hypothetical protein
MYIQVGKAQILGRFFLPCKILSVGKKACGSAYIICVYHPWAEDSSHATINANLLHDNISMPLQTPGRIRTRFLSSLWEDSEIWMEDWASGIQETTDTLDVNIS